MYAGLETVSQREPNWDWKEECLEIRDRNVIEKKKAGLNVQWVSHLFFPIYSFIPWVCKYKEHELCMTVQGLEHISAHGSKLSGFRVTLGLLPSTTSCKHVTLDHSVQWHKQADTASRLHLFYDSRSDTILWVVNLVWVVMFVQSH